MEKSNNTIMMMKSLVLSVLVLFLVACEGKKEVHLPKSNQSLVTTIGEHSPVYIFFSLKGKDTIADLNRSNTISSTHWVFNIDKRLPLRLVIPQVMKMQAKKEKSMHKNETSENYFSYADSLHKNLAFVSFTNVTYKMEKPMSSFIVFFSKKNEVFVDGTRATRQELKQFLTSLKEHYKIIRFSFDKDMSFESYIQNEILIQSSKIKRKEAFIY